MLTPRACTATPFSWKKSHHSFRYKSGLFSKVFTNLSKHGSEYSQEVTRFGAFSHLFAFQPLFGVACGGLTNCCDPLFPFLETLKSTTLGGFLFRQPSSKPALFAVSPRLHFGSLHQLLIVLWGVVGDSSDTEKDPRRLVGMRPPKEKVGSIKWPQRNAPTLFEGGREVIKTASPSLGLCTRARLFRKSKKQAPISFGACLSRIAPQQSPPKC